MDLLRYGQTDVPTLEEIAREICLLGGEDGLQFLPDSVKGSNIREEEIYGGVRLNLLAMLEKAHIPVQIDVGSGDAVTPPAKEERLPTILDLPAPQIRIYPKEMFIAEKFDDGQARHRKQPDEEFLKSRVIKSFKLVMVIFQ